MNRFRILSLDGGGIKGAFTASVVAELEKSTGKRIIDHFDLIAGTSIGGIIALGLGLGKTGEKMCDFFRDSGPRIFPGRGLLGNMIKKVRQLKDPIYSQETLRKELEKVFQNNQKLGESLCRLVIPTYDVNEGRIFLMKTAHHKRFKYDINAKAVDVALATSAAPTFFDFATFPEHAAAKYIDGGVWSNCPALTGLVEAVHFLDIPLDRIEILSIGAVTEPFDAARHDGSGLLDWSGDFIQLMFMAQSEAAYKQAMLLTNKRLHRIDLMVKAGRFGIDTASPREIEELISLGRGVAVRAEHLSVVESRFLNDIKAEPFKPLHQVNAGPAAQ